MRSFVFIILIPFFSFSQQKDYSSCEYALEVKPSGSYSFAFLGKKGVVSSVGVFQHLKNPSKNQIWIHYTCPSKGNLNLSFQQKLSPVNILVFKEEREDFCLTLKNQAHLVLLEKSIDSIHVLETQLQVAENDQLYFLFVSEEKSKQTIECEFSFENDEISKETSWPLNLAFNESLPIYSLMIRDEKTKKPVEAKIVLQGSNEINGIYRCSDLSMNINKRVKGGVIRIDAEGYLSRDIENTFIPIGSDLKDTIWLKSIKEGMMAELEDVYFSAGLAAILEESYPKLKRLRDFLILNPDVSIEIHGHVNEDKDKDLFSMKLSKKRAQKVVDYLIDGGVDAKRLKAIGFGNTKPIYKDPQNEEEKEANRRVEIKISTH